MFIVMEGHDGLGKSTQVKILAEHLTRLGYDVLVTHSPGGEPTADKLRSIALYSDPPVEPITRALLTQASRIENWRNLIAPHLKKDKAIVISDRWHWSGYLYQCVGEGMSLDQWLLMSDILHQSRADLTIVLTMDELARKELIANQDAIVYDSAGNVKPACIMESQGSDFETRIADAISRNEQLLRFTSSYSRVEYGYVDAMAADIYTHVYNKMLSMGME